MNRTPATRRLSSSLTSLYKKLFPRLLLLAGFGAVGITLWNTVSADDGETPFGFLVFLVAVTGIAYALSNTIASGLADAVFDGGDHLRVRIGDLEEVILIHEVESVKESLFLRQPPRIELVLKYSGTFGRVIAFVPARYSLIPFSRSALFYELEERVRIAHALGKRT